MKRLIYIVVIFILIPFSYHVFPQSLSEIIDLHFDAVKHDAFNKIQTMMITSEIVQMNGKIPVKTYFKRPDKMRMEITENGKTRVTAYDGRIAWCIDPEATGIAPKELTGVALDETKFMADLDGYFFCYREKRHTVTLEGKEKVLNRNAYKIKCKISPTDSSYVFLDAKNYLIVKIVKLNKQKGDKETYLSNYKKVGGVNFPFKFEVITPNSRTFQLIKSIKTGMELPDSLFAMPK
ncbi:MAG: outer membrane lipoprotein-sorting protein [Ignavibacteriaceae bacterium]